MNEGCIPTKTLLRSAEVMHLIRDRAHEFGVRGVDPSALWFDLAAAVARKNQIIQGVIDGIYGWVNQSDRITFMRGRAEFVSPVDIRVDGRTITAGKSIIAAGSRTADVQIPGLREVGCITNYEALQLGKLPSSLIVIGGGYVGVEFAQMYARYGTKVTLLSRNPRLMRHEEPELSQVLADILLAEGVDVRLNAAARRAESAGSDKVIIADVDGKEVRFQAEEILFAAGRVPRADDLGQAQAGVEMGPQGIRVDEKLHTTAANIWSLGDVNGGPCSPTGPLMMAPLLRSTRCAAWGEQQITALCLALFLPNRLLPAWG